VQEERTILAMDSSQLDTFMSCETLWGFTYDECLRLPDANTTKRDMGTLVHDLLARYYTIRTLTPGSDWLNDGGKAFEELVASRAIQSFGFDIQETGKFLRERWINYLMTYPPDRDGLAPALRSKDGRAGVEVGFARIIYQDKVRVYVLEGRIDLLSKRTGYGVIWDHKSQEKAQNFYKYTPQFKTYSLATGYRYIGVNYFGLQAEKTDKTFRRTITQIPEFLIDEWKTNIIKIFHKVYDYKVLGKPLEKNRSTCPGTFDSFPCVFSRICDEPAEKHELLKWFNFIKVKPWKPWMEEEVLMEL